MDLSKQPPLPDRQPGWVGAFLHAWDGLVWTTAYQRNMKFHVLAAVLVGCVGSGIPLGLPEKVTLVFCVMLVFFSEVINSALEALVDLHTERYHDLAKVAKDTAAAGVLVLSIGTFVVFAVILDNDWHIVMGHPQEVLRQLAVGTPLAALGATLPWKRPRPHIFDALAFFAALALWVATGSWTASPVFSAMIASLLCLQAAAAYELRWRRKA
ncbi:MAG: diacylglycerol kinase family protein [Deltaproteobacteria bacterium]|nr:diacylglycerol kinase family protein [Deltaproteobacteria bacterium]